MDRTIAIVVCGLLAASGPALAQKDHEGDIGLKIVGSNLLTGIVEALPGGGEIVVPGQRVFAAEFADIGGGVVYADAPGLFGEVGNFPVGSLRFDVTSAVLGWSGSAFLSASPETITLEYGPLSATTGGGFVGGFGIPVSPAGFDEHYDFFLNAPTSNGIYLLELVFTLENTSIAATDKTWLVFNWGLSEPEHEAAVEWVEQNLVPAPGAIAAIGMAALALCGRRREGGPRPGR